MIELVQFELDRELVDLGLWLDCPEQYQYDTITDTSNQIDAEIFGGAA